MALAIGKLKTAGLIPTIALVDYVAAISVGLETGRGLLDLCYEEDVRIGTDMNFVMTGSGKFIEIQGTAETQPFSREELSNLTDLAEIGCHQLFKAQAEIIGQIFPPNFPLKGN